MNNLIFREKSLVQKSLERMVRDLQEAKEKCDELRASKQVRGWTGSVVIECKCVIVISVPGCRP